MITDNKIFNIKTEYLKPLYTNLKNIKIDNLKKKLNKMKSLTNSTTVQEITLVIKTLLPKDTTHIWFYRSVLSNC